MKSIRKSKFLSLLLVMCLIVGMTQVTAQADEVINNDEDIPIPEITIVQEPSDITVIQGAITEKLSVTATTSNNTPISYQWADENGEPINGETSSEFVIPTGLDAGTYYYYCVLSAEGCTDKSSIPVRVKVEPKTECSHEFGTNWWLDLMNHWRQCSCGEKAEVEAHQFSDWIVISEPTETTVGIRKKECTLCTLTISEDIPTIDTKEYNLEDVQKINTLIDNSYLEATKDDPESWSDFASWDDATPKNLIGLDFTSKPNVFLGAAEISNFNNLETLKMGTQEAILALYCGNNRLTSLEVSQLSSLQTLDCTGNQLSSLEVNGLSELTMLDCSGNQLSNLAVSDLPSLTTLNCYNNELNSLDVSDLSSLASLNCDDNKLSSLDVSGLPNLTSLMCYNNKLSSLEVGNLSKLDNLYCNNNELSSLNVSGLSGLIDLRCYNNQLSEVNLDGLKNLTKFYGAGNPIATFTNQEGKTLSISQEAGTIFMGLPLSEWNHENYGYNVETEVITLYTPEETFEKWKFSQDVTFAENTNNKSNPVAFKLLENVNAELAQDSQESILVTDIIISGEDKIETKSGTLQLDAEVKPDNADNKGVVWSSSDVDIALVDSEGLVTAKTDGVVIITATAIDGSGVTNSKEITITNQVEYNLEDVQKINNLINSSDLEANVDNPESWADFASWDDSTPKNLIGLDFSDQDDVFSGCVDISNFEKLATLTMGNQPNLDELDCLDNQLSRLDVSGLSNINYLDCSGNQLTSLDVNALSKLETLYCENNELSSLNASNVSGLEVFWCYNNQLSELNLNGLQHLWSFYGAGNPIATFTNQEGKTLSVSQEDGTIFMGLPNRENPQEVAMGYDINTKIITLHASEEETFKEWAFSQDVTFAGNTNEKSNPVYFKLAEDVNAGLLQKEPEEKPVTEIIISGADKIETKAGKIQLEAEVKPDDADNKEVTWKSSDSSIATVDANGLVTAKADGKVDIMATAIDGSNVTGSKEITITNQSEGAEEVQPIIYEIIGDKEGTWTKGSKEGYTIKSSGDVEKFLSVTFNGEKIATEDFTVEAGSTILTLKPEFLEKQSADTHNIRLEYSDGYAQTTLKIAQEAGNGTNEKPTNPSESAGSDTKGTGGTGTTKTSASANTGDSASTLAYIFLLLIAAFAGTVSYQRKKSRK